MVHDQLTLHKVAPYCFKMGTNAVQRGPTARTVSENVAHLRDRRNLTLRGLARKLSDAGRPLNHSAVDQIEKGARRVDVDDLMALAAALDVSPITLLMPAKTDSSTIVDATGVGGGVSAERLWDWLNASNPLRGAVMTFWADALPPWMSAELARQMGPAMGGLLDQLRAPRGTHGDN